MEANRIGFLPIVLILSSFATGIAVGQAPQNSNTVLVADVELAQIPVIVFDEKGKIVTDLQKSDFRVVEDQIEQQLLYCDKERESVSFVILGDVSQSMTNKIEFVRQASESVLNPLYPQDAYQDEYSLFAIESRVKQLTPFTQDQADLQRRLPTLLTPTNGGTALFDGLYAGALAAGQEANNKRRAMIIISDGGDNSSRHNIRQTKKFLQEADVPIFAVMAGPQFEQPLIMPQKKNPLPVPQQKSPIPFNIPIPLPVPNSNFIGPAEREGPRNFKTLTEATGGGVFTAYDSESLVRITRTISAAVRYQYVLSYKPQGTRGIKRQDNWHNIHVDLIPNDKFKGYNIYYKHRYYRNDESKP